MLIWIIDLDMFLDDANDQDNDEMERENGYPTNDDIYTDQEQIPTQGNSNHGGRNNAIR